MSHGVTERIKEQQEFFAGQAAEAETLGQLPVETISYLETQAVII